MKFKRHQYRKKLPDDFEQLIQAYVAVRGVYTMALIPVAYNDFARIKDAKREKVYGIPMYISIYGKTVSIWPAPEKATTVRIVYKPCTKEI